MAKHKKKPARKRPFRESRPPKRDSERTAPFDFTKILAHSMHTKREKQSRS